MNIIVIVTDNFPISPKAFKNVCKVHIVFVEMKKATLWQKQVTINWRETKELIDLNCPKKILVTANP